MLGAMVLRAARGAAPGRAPISLDLNFLRGVRAGDTVVTVDVLSAGRSMTAVEARIVSEDRVCTHAVAKLVDDAVLADVEVPGIAAARPPAPDYSSGKSWGNAGIPIIESLKPRTILSDDPRGVGLAFEVPWDEPGADAEAACLAADGCVGPPVAFAAGGRFTHPNPDIALRFLPDAIAGPEVVGFGRVERAAAGAALVSLEVWSGICLLAVGVSSSLQLPARSSTP